MSILTDEEMKQIHADTFGKGLQSFARAIEAAVLSKLAEQAGEPVAWEWVNPEKGMCISHQEPPEYEEVYQISKLYTEAQLIAAQQRTAEACAKVIRGECIGFADDDEELNRLAAMLEAGEWRRYL